MQVHFDVENYDDGQPVLKEKEYDDIFKFKAKEQLEEVNGMIDQQNITLKYNKIKDFDNTIQHGNGDSILTT